jgi:hypothetical protein
MDPNALSPALPASDIDSLSRSLEEAQVSLMRLLTLHKELSKRLGAAALLSHAKTDSQKHVHVSVLQSPEVPLACPSAWQYRTPSPIRSSESSHSRIWSVTTCRSPIVSEFKEPKPRRTGWGVCVVLLGVLLLWIVLWSAERLRSSLVVI